MIFGSRPLSRPRVATYRADTQTADPDPLPEWIARLVRDSHPPPHPPAPTPEESSPVVRENLDKGRRVHTKKRTAEIGGSLSRSTTKPRTAQRDRMPSSSRRYRVRKPSAGNRSPGKQQSTFTTATAAATGRQDPPNTAHLEPFVSPFLHGGVTTSLAGQGIVSHERVRLDEPSQRVDVETAATTTRGPVERAEVTRDPGTTGDGHGFQQLLAAMDADARMSAITKNVKFR